ncbi:hypothetical protein AO057_12395 [Curvibacter sp. PAE-UM]|nr:hypothetical protein AO057_12395 [Curvibacter sp. PAE-UM]
MFSEYGSASWLGRPLLDQFNLYPDLMQEFNYVMRQIVELAMRFVGQSSPRLLGEMDQFSQLDHSLLPVLFVRVVRSHKQALL